MDTRFAKHRRGMAVLVATLFLFQNSFLAAKSRTLELRWSELDAVVYGQDTKLTLRDGTWIKGAVLGVGPEALAMEIRSTSNKKAYPQGLATIPRGTVTGLEVTERRRSDDSRWGNSLLREADATGPFVEQTPSETRPRRRCHDESWVGSNNSGDGRAALVAAGIVGAILAIHAIQRATDKRVTRYKLVEESQQAAGR